MRQSAFDCNSIRCGATQCNAVKRDFPTFGYFLSVLDCSEEFSVLNFSNSKLQEKWFVLGLNLLFVFQNLSIYLWIQINKVSNYRQILQLQRKTVRSTDVKFGSHFIDFLPILSVSNFGKSCGLSSIAAFSSIFPGFFKNFVLAAYIPKRLFSRLLRQFKITG